MPLVTRILGDSMILAAMKIVLDTHRNEHPIEALVREP
jgi:hypothetical protein